MLSASSSSMLGPSPKAPIVRRKSVIQQIGSWLGREKRPSDGLGKKLVAKMPTFRKRVKAGKVIYDVGGKKTISYWGAYVYLLNQFLDCLPSIPYVILAAGWLPAFVANMSVCAIASFIALMTMRSMTMIKGNQNFELRYEYVPTAQHFLGPTVALCLEVGFHVLQILNFLAINSVSRLLDIMLLQALGFTAGVSLYPSVAFKTVTRGGSLETLYTVAGTSTAALTVSLGYCLCGLVCIPISRYNLNEGLSAQLAILGVALVAISVVVVSALKTLVAAASLNSFLLLLPSWIAPLFSMFLNSEQTSTAVPAADASLKLLQTITGLDPFTLLRAKTSDTNLFVKLASSPGTCAPCASDLCMSAAARSSTSPTLWDPLLEHLVAKTWMAEKLGARPTAPSRWGRYQFQRTFGIFIGGYSFTSMVPSWANELQSNVEIPTVLWRSTISACFLFFGFGWLLAFAFPDIDDEDALQHIIRHHAVPNYVAFSVYSLELVTVALGVIVNCIATRYNLTNNGVFRSSSTAFFFGCVCPFLFAWVFAVESWVTAAFGWAALILSLTCNFVAPAYVYIVACRTSPLAYRNPSRHRTFRLGIEAFVPQRGSVPDVQAALREWALTQTAEDPELRALLESSDMDTRTLMSSQQRRFSSSVSGGMGQSETPEKSSPRSRARSETIDFSNSSPRVQASHERSVHWSEMSVLPSCNSSRKQSLRRNSVNISNGSHRSSLFLGQRKRRQSSVSSQQGVGDNNTSPLCLSDIRRRFTVMQIVESYQRASSRLSQVKLLTKKRSLRSSASGSVGSKEAAESGEVPGWHNLVADYERRLAAGELEYTDEEDDDEDEDMESASVKLNHTQNKDMGGSVESVVVTRSQKRQMTMRRNTGRQSMAFSDYSEHPTSQRRSVRHQTSKSAGYNATSDSRPANMSPGLTRLRKSSFLMTPEQLGARERPRRITSVDRAIEPRSLASSIQKSGEDAVDLILLPPFQTPPSTHSKWVQSQSRSSF